MRVSDFKQCLALSPLNFSTITCDVVGTGNKRLWEVKKHNHYNPLEHALVFYVANHLIAHRIYTKPDNHTLTPEEEELVTRYITTVAEYGTAMFTYLCLICTRESRHVKSHSSEKVYSLTVDKEIVSHHQAIPGTSTDAANHFATNNLKQSFFPDYAAFLYRVFSVGSFSSGYGGSAWASVAKPLMLFAEGKLSLEGLLDQGFTLAHNNGPIFNKGMIYSHPNTQYLLKLLDYQKMGVLPQKVHSDAASINVPASTDLVWWLSKFKPEELNHKVDEALVSKHGVSAPATPYKEAATSYKTAVETAPDHTTIKITGNISVIKGPSPRKGKINPETNEPW